MNTDIHWLALFLHPLCRKLAISAAVHSRTVSDACRLALDLASRWKWSKDRASALVKDIQDYHSLRAPFNAIGSPNAVEWWQAIPVVVSVRPLKALALIILKIVPHAAEVERFFSNLGGVQSVRRSRLSVSHMETLGMLRNHYTHLLHEEALKMAKSTRRKHAHMHTREEPGINTEH
ncbi:hypothetical protein H0H92_000624, partial [Tricholoma furcatifolium]